MYVINQSKGIGEVIEVLENAFVVYFEETDEEKKLLKAFTKTYETIEEAELALNPELTEEGVAEINAELEAEKLRKSEALKAARFIEEHNLEVSKNLMKNI